jgi:hypothetical protein
MLAHAWIALASNSEVIDQSPVTRRAASIARARISS